MKRAVFPGSFDPVTNGHMDLIARAADLFDELIVAVVNNADKKCMFTIDERVEFIKRATKGSKNVTVESFDGLLIDYVKEKKADVIVRGVRCVRDFDYEYELADIYFTTGGAETVMLPSRGKNAHVSSSMVRELIKYRKDASEFIPFELK